MGETSSSHTYRDDVSSAPPSTSCPAHRATPTGRVSAKVRLGPRSEIQRVNSGASVVDEEGFQQPKRKNLRASAPRSTGIVTGARNTATPCWRQVLAYATAS